MGLGPCFIFFLLFWSYLAALGHGCGSIFFIFPCISSYFLGLDLTISSCLAYSWSMGLGPFFIFSCY